MRDSSIDSAGWEGFKRSAPMTRAFNHLIAGTHFQKRFHRWPLPPHDPAATINDFIFTRMIDPLWSTFERAWVDKETAKVEVSKSLPTLRVPETRLVIQMETVRSVDELYAMLRPFLGTDSIAKPTHASGGATLMRNVVSAEDLGLLKNLGSIDYAFIMREMQYLELPKKIIVESLVPANLSPPDDYKFHCVNGEPLVCQVDHNRLGAAWSRLFRVPDFHPLDEADGLTQPEGYKLPTLERLASMTAAARILAAPFKFVRVDLYNGRDDVYFGELTFTPAASLGIAPSSRGDHAENATHGVYSRTIMSAIMSEPASIDLLA